jgi:microcystin-dependent protein
MPPQPAMTTASQVSGEKRRETVDLRCIRETPPARRARDEPIFLWFTKVAVAGSRLLTTMKIISSFERVRTRRALRWTMPAALVGVAAAAYAAAPLHTFSTNEVLQASDLNGNFAALQAQIAAAQVPAGVVVPFAGPVAPPGYLACNGEAVNRADYPALFAAIGTVHGSGNGATTFNLPDYRGRFLRGVDGMAGRDPDSGKRGAPGNGGNAGNSVGSVQDSLVGRHTHGITDPGHGHALNIDIALGGLWTFGDDKPNNWGVNQGAHQPPAVRAASATTGVSVDSAGGAETRPANAYVNYVIKY